MPTSKILFDPAFPLIIMVLLAVLLFGSYLLRPNDSVPLEKTQKASSFYVPNEPSSKVQRAEIGEQAIITKPTAKPLARGQGVSSRAEQVKLLLLQAWQKYMAFARGHDELRPTSNRTNDSWGGYGVTLIDGIDTLWIMGLKQEFRDAVSYLTSSVKSFDRDYDASFFETTIRHLGGLLSASGLSGDSRLLDLARDLGTRLAQAFKEGAALPLGVINLSSGAARTHRWTQGRSVLAEIGSFQVEFMSLSCQTGDDKFATLATNAWAAIEHLQDEMGLFPTLLDPEKLESSTKERTIGGLSDSFFEYLIKGYFFSNNTDERLLKMYENVVQGLRDVLVRRSVHGGLTYVGNIAKNGEFSKRFDHLSCFIPAMLFQGAHGPTAEIDVELGKEILKTCVELYRQSPTGLAPESVEFDVVPGQAFTIREKRYVLRPETIESLFWLYKKTGDPWAQEAAWEIFVNFRRFTTAPFGLSGLDDVTCGLGEDVKDVQNVRSTLRNKFYDSDEENREVLDCSSYQNDSQQSFVFAETLKYFYLLFVDDIEQLLPSAFNDYVLNTEGHLLRKC